MVVEKPSQDKHSDNLIKFENLALRSAGANCMTKPASLRFRGKLFSSVNPQATADRLIQCAYRQIHAMLTSTRAASILQAALDPTKA